MADAGHAGLPSFAVAMLASGRDVFVEQSVKFTAEHCERNRVLVGVARRAGDIGLRREVLALAASGGLPQNLADAFDLRFDHAHMVHFGLEGIGEDQVRKLYLEFPTPPADLPDVRFLAWKWQRSGKAVSSYYRRVPVADVRPLAEVAEMPPPVVKAFVELSEIAAQRLGSDRVVLLAVEEVGTPRLSLDLNLYDCNLALHEITDPIYSALVGLGHHDRDLGFEARDRLGHLSAGRSRHGHAFLTVYAGARLMKGQA